MINVIKSKDFYRLGKLIGFYLRVFKNKWTSCSRYEENLLENNEISNYFIRNKGFTFSKFNAVVYFAKDHKQKFQLKRKL